MPDSLEKGCLEITKKRVREPRYFALLILVVCVLSTGCADYFPMERSGVIQIRLPAENADGLVDVKILDVQVPEGVEFAENILKMHEFSRMVGQNGADASDTAPALQLMNSPNSIQPATMPEASRSTWELSIPHRGTIPDKVYCSIYPTGRSELLQVSVTVEYAGHVPPLVTEFWRDLVTQITAKYGLDRVSIDTNIRLPKS